MHRNWYHSAQEVRIRQEASVEAAVEDDSDGETLARPPPTSQQPTTLEDVPEEAATSSTEPSNILEETRTKAQQAALGELYIHEMMALIWCFLCPMVAAYILHTIRGQLSRPSEGLVSDYNLTIFLLASELRPLSHLMKLVQARTLHLQRVVGHNPYKEETVSVSQFQDLGRRLEYLESRSVATEAKSPVQSGGLDSSGPEQNAALIREVRNAIQPELDALNRAVRRYEKKATVLAFQTESRLGALDTRLDDAIALAAAAAKNSVTQWSLLNWLVDSTVAILMLPLQVSISLLLFPVRATIGAFQKNKNAAPEKSSRNRSRTASQTRHGGDRVSSRVAKR
jgi:hypothetical protein